MKTSGVFILIATNVLQLGAVCVGLWEGNCAKVLLPVCGGIVGEPVAFNKKIIFAREFLNLITKKNDRIKRTTKQSI